MIAKKQPIKPGMIVRHDEGLLYRVDDVRQNTSNYEQAHTLDETVVINYTQLEQGSFPPGTKWSKDEAGFRAHFTIETSNVHSTHKPDLSEVENLMSKLVFPFYRIERDAVPPIEPRRFENDVEHSWSVAMLACSLAPEIDKTLDTGKIAQFAIVHDLVELYAGDTSPWQNTSFQASKEDREEEGLRLIAEQFAAFPWIHQTIKDYESKVSNEAMYVWAVDKIIILLLRYLDQGKYYVDNGITKRLFDERLASHRQKAHAYPAIGEYYDQLLQLFEAHPEYFHQGTNATAQR